MKPLVVDEIIHYLIHRWGKKYDFRLFKRGNYLYFQMMWGFLGQESFPLSEVEYKKSIAEKLECSLDVFRPYKDIARFYKTQITNLRKDIYSEQEKAHFQKAFIRYNDTQDRYRENKTWRGLLPELEKALTESLS